MRHSVRSPVAPHIRTRSTGSRSTAEAKKDGGELAKIRLKIASIYLLHAFASIQARTVLLRLRFTMSADLDASQFEILFCQAESPPIRPSFHPFEHDLIILDAAGVLRIAETKKATAQLMKSILSDSNESLFTPCKGGDDSPVSLAIM